MDADEALVGLLIRFEDAAAAGTPATPEELCRERPQLLSEFRALLRNVGAVNAALEGAATGPADADYPIGAVVDDRYRPLGFHAAGGMGVVFTAEDGEVGRTVALKRMQGWAAADETARERFLAEAEVTGRLEHPGVVPVYGLGRDASGQPYYAMRFIGGSTLREEVHRYHAAPGPARPIEFARLLRAFAAVCETVAYAHARGVVHRDIKPGNVMLGPYGETLLVDWGLAKRVGVPDPEAATGPGAGPLAAGTGAAASVPGTVKGTPAYMSPEQARGETDRVGPASDVFGLGATLYALLTGRAPYDGSGALGQAREGRFAVPRRVRRDVPRPLEAICLKATAVRPEDRYPGAKEMARDIERWLADEPVSAWREPLPVRATRWAKRHRTLLTTTAALLALAVVGLAVAGSLLTRKNRQLTEANLELERRNTELATTYAAARDDFGAAHQTVSTFPQVHQLLTRAGNHRSVDPVRRATLLTTRAYYRDFRERNRGRGELRAELARASLEQARAEAQLGDAAAARVLLDAAARQLDGLLAEQPENPRLREHSADADIEYAATLCGDRGRRREAFDRAFRGCAALEPLLDAPDEGATGSRLAPRFALGCSLVLLLHTELTRYETAPCPPEHVLAWLLKAETVLDRYAARGAAERVLALSLRGSIQEGIGQHLVDAGRRGDGRRAYERASQTIADARKDYPDDPEAVMTSAVVDLRLAELLLDDGKVEAATVLFEAVRASGRTLAARTEGVSALTPQHLAALGLQAEACRSLAQIASRTDPRATRALLDEALAALRRVAGAAGTDEDVILGCVGAVCSLGRDAATRGDYGWALGAMRFAGEQLDRAPASFRGAPEVVRVRAVIDGWTGICLFLTERDKVPELDRAVVALANYLQRAPGDRDARRNWLIFRAWQGAGRARQGDGAGAVKQVKEVRDELVGAAGKYGPGSPESALSREAAYMLGLVHESYALQLAGRTPPDRREALEQVEAGLTLVAESAKSGGLRGPEKALQGRLAALKMTLGESK